MFQDVPQAPCKSGQSLHMEGCVRLCSLLFVIGIPVNNKLLHLYVLCLLFFENINFYCLKTISIKAQNVDVL